jgi:hypothetical protein
MRKQKVSFQTLLFNTVSSVILQFNVFRRELFPRPGAGTTPGWNPPPLPPATSVPPSVLCPPQSTVATVESSCPVCVFECRAL